MRLQWFHLEQTVARLKFAKKVAVAFSKQIHKQVQKTPWLEAESVFAQDHEEKRERWQSLREAEKQLQQA